MTRRRLALLSPLFCILLLACDSSSVTAPLTTRVFDVTIENLTTGQPFSPGVIVAHTEEATVWRVGTTASEGVRLIAENGDPSTAADELSGVRGVSQVVTIDAPVHRLGGPGPSSATYRIVAAPGVARLSLVAMTICTNDGFVGLDSVILPESGGVTLMADAYDAGTESNDEQFASIPDGCQVIGPVPAPPDGNARPTTSDTIMGHPGVVGSGQLLPDQHGWQDPVARIRIQQVG